MRSVITAAAAAVALVAVGLGAGWWFAGGGAPAGTQEGAPTDEPPKLSEQALRNLGVRVESATLSNFVQTTRVQATVVDAPLNARPLVSALGGLVLDAHVRPGALVRPGDPLITIARSGIPRPDLVLTGDLLPSLSEEFHEAVAAYRNASTDVVLVRRELDRVRRFTESGTDGGLPVLPGQTRIDLEYQLTRAEQVLENARHEVERHGLSSDEMEMLAEESLVVGNHRLWRNALHANGFWTETEDAVLAELPPHTREVPWVVGALGELVATGRDTAGLVDAMRQVPQLSARFPEALCLLIGGDSVTHVARIAAAGELEPTVVVRAPEGAPDWDVSSIEVRVGERVEAGASLATLHDARQMWLRLEPVGDEISAVAAAIRSRAGVEARPLLEGAGPTLDSVRIDRFDTRGGQHERGAVATVVCKNTPIEADGSDSRSWGLREGLQYVLLVPRSTFEQRFVLPAESVVQDGPERAVFVRDGDAFRLQPVHIEFEDEDVVVIANDGSIYPGDHVVTTGAFGLGLSLQSSAKADPHAGHSH